MLNEVKNYRNQKNSDFGIWNQGQKGVEEKDRK